MRVLASNPDTIGDLVLRQPMYDAIQRAGHELMMVVRPLLTPVARWVTPGAALVECDPEPYDAKLTPDSESLAEVVSKAKEFDPDVLLIAPFQWTALEERLASALPRARLVAMTGSAFSVPDQPAAYEPTLASRASVEATEDLPELRKNERLAAGVLGQSVVLPTPKLTVDRASLDLAEAELGKLGLKASGYWVACVGHTKWTAVRNWSTDRWAVFFERWTKSGGPPVLFIGQASEQATCAPMLEAMRRADGVCAEWFGSTNGEIDTLAGLVGLSSGYIGRDTGPMHIAAAMDKPVLAVFGGGTWPRFLPATEKSISITMGVPCIGCGWKCHLERSCCIKDIPVDAVWKAAEELRSGSVKSRSVRILEAPAPLLHEITKGSVASARAKRVELAAAKDLLERRTTIVFEQMKLLERAVRAETQLAAAREEVTKAEAQAKLALTEARSQAHAAAVRVGEIQALLSVERPQLTAATQRIATLEKQLGDRDRDLRSANEQVATIKQQADGVRAELATTKGELAKSKSQPAPAGAPANGAAASEQARQRESELQEALQRAETERSKAESLLTDSRLRNQKLVGDVSAAAALTKVQQQEIATLRERLANLQSSRWRKLGQRLGVAMTMPWERESTNGKA